MTLTAILVSYESTYAAINNNVSETYIDENRNLVRTYPVGTSHFPAEWVRHQWTEPIQKSKLR